MATKNKKHHKISQLRCRLYKGGMRKTTPLGNIQKLFLQEAHSTKVILKNFEVSRDLPDDPMYEGRKNKIFGKKINISHFPSIVQYVRILDFVSLKCLKISASVRYIDYPGDIKNPDYLSSGMKSHFLNTCARCVKE